MNPAPFTNGDVFDAVMFYQAYRPARYFFAKTNMPVDAAQLRDSLTFEWNRLKKANRFAMMNVSSTHDSPRLLSDFYNPGKYKYNASPGADAGYKTGKPDEETYARVRLYLIHLFTTIGAPQIWNGEEMGMWGADDPHCRKPLMWPDMKFDPETRNNIQPGTKSYDKPEFNQAQYDMYKKLIQIRKQNSVLSDGDISFLVSSGKHLAYKRFDKTGSVLVIFNLDSKEWKFALPQNRYNDLINNKIIKDKTLKIKPLSAFILKEF
jgi:glycosidase